MSAKDKQTKDEQVKSKKAAVDSKDNAKNISKDDLANKDGKNTAGKLDKAAEIKHVLTGKVVSDKMDKTVVVTVSRQIKHKTGKYCRTSRKYKVHDENNSLKIGDKVIIGEVKPISKDKSWSLISVITHATGEEK